LNNFVTQSNGISLSSPGKLDNPFGYYCHGGIIAIDQTQLMQCFFERCRERRDSVRFEDFLFLVARDPNSHLSRYALRRASH
jgi:hypothetical protein